MPKFLRNWVFEEVQDFLANNYFVLLPHRPSDGSHHYFLGFVDGEQRLVELQYHAKESIHPKTLKLCVIKKSGIPQECWLEYAQSGKKNVTYKGATSIPQGLLEKIKADRS